MLGSALVTAREDIDNPCCHEQSQGLNFAIYRLGEGIETTVSFGKRYRKGYGIFLA